ncbi:hypothetical protein [Methylicorpusculum sp.]|uniref:hypothetical protein n=1 Tax=Methylicorpusculum sp. TaxID=2713644 RepID=UPI002ABCEB60|nr:hypothetical protein [Methylicorpusculum sp.]MDZ4150481.1 hypothetical protein [Methylicorpusculum sp.]
MIKKLINYLLDVRDRQQMAIALGKGGSMMQSRSIDLMRPSTWEFSGFSQNGEDGILDVLRKQLLNSNRYFIEIGSADGMQNNSSWLVVAEQYNGLMIEGNPRLVERTRRMLQNHSIGLECLNMFVDSENIQELRSLALHSNPDVFSLDIDGIDYYIAKAVIEGGFRPKIFVVEYNSAFGPERRITIPYQENFVFTQAHPTHLYYGVSIAAWRNFFSDHGYRFVAVDSKGVNAFFVDPECFDEVFLNAIIGPPFAENAYQFRKFRGTFEEQFLLIANQQFLEI